VVLSILALRRAEACAVANPIPLEAPVITTVASSRLSMIPWLLSPTLGRRMARYVWRYYPLERGFKSSYSRYRHRYLSPRHYRIVNATRPDRWPRYLQYIGGSHHPPKVSFLVCGGREAEEGTVRGSNNLGQERKSVLSAGLGSSALGTTEAVYPDRRMLTSRRTRLAYR
jgi:hypothetical protein